MSQLVDESHLYPGKVPHNLFVAMLYWAGHLGLVGVNMSVLN